ncbi:hypothetical protein [Amycolatopsis sp. NPDC004079]|uniref:hypothetical protein n=1 Tax=Amycolatopsis sp. NPDC004079 TaxID=3154549 RepID=UPI0033BEADDF
MDATRTATSPGYGTIQPGIGSRPDSHAGPEFADGLRAGLHELEYLPLTVVVRFGTELLPNGAPTVASRVDLYRIQVGTALPIGVGEVAEQAREMLRWGFDGWVMPEMPDEPEPLQTRQPLLPPRLFGVLSRNRFRSVEELELIPDTALRELPNMGKKGISALRRVIPARVPASHAQPTPPATPETIIGVLGEIRDLLLGIDAKLDRAFHDGEASGRPR